MPDMVKYIAIGLFGLVAGASLFGLAALNGRYQEAAASLAACNQECSARLGEYGDKLKRAKEEQMSLAADKDRIIADLEATAKSLKAENDSLRTQRDTVSQAILVRLDAIAAAIEAGREKTAPADQPQAQPQSGEFPGTEKERAKLERQGNHNSQ